MQLRSRQRWYAAILAVVVLGAACVPPPDGGGGSGPVGTVQIDGGREFTSSTEVTLELTWERSYRVRIATGPDPTGAEWMAVAPTVAWTLPAGDGPTTISAQFADAGDAVSAVVTASIVLDTSPPSLTVTTHAAGDTVDLRNGAPIGLGGVADDGEGSGVDVVTVSDGSQAIDAVVDDDIWGAPLGADDPGSVEYVITAVDRAGNPATTSIPLEILLPDPDVTVVRPTVVDATPLAGQVVAIDDERVVFSGDRRSFFAGKLTVLMDQVAPAPFGLLRSIDDVRWDSSTSTTTLVSGDASIFDVYAQYAPPQPLVARASSSPAADRCEGYADSADLGALVNLPEVGADIPLPWPGPSHSTVGAELDPTVAVGLDANLRWSSGFPPRLADGSYLRAGAMVCTEWEATAEHTVDSVLGPQFEVGVLEDRYSPDYGIRNLDLGGSGFGLLKVNSAGQPASTFCTKRLPTGTGIPFGPLPLRLHLTAALRLCSTDLTWSAGASMRADTAIGATVGIERSGGSYRPTFEPTMDGGIGALEVFADGAMKWSPHFAFGVKANADPAPGSRWTEWLDRVNATGKFAEVGFELGPEANVSWAGDLIARSGTRTDSSVDLCADAYAELGAELSINLDLGTILGRRIQRRWNLLDVTLARQELRIGCHNIYRQGQTPEQIDTTSLPNASQHRAYSANLESSAPATWTLVSGSLPPGLALAPSGVISGIPTEQGASQFRVRATFLTGHTAEVDLGIEVGPVSRWTFMRWGTSGVTSNLYRALVPDYFPTEIDSAVYVRLADWDAETSGFLFGDSGNVGSLGDEWHLRFGGDQLVFKLRTLNPATGNQQDHSRYVPRSHIPFEDGKWIWLRVRYTTEEGVTFYYSTDSGDEYPRVWNDLGPGWTSPTMLSRDQPYLGRPMHYFSSGPGTYFRANLGSTGTNGIGLGGDIRRWYLSDPSGELPPYVWDPDQVDNLGATVWGSGQGPLAMDINGWTWQRGAPATGASNEVHFYGSDNAG